uniref:DDA1 domain-containing protein n=1 Tax=Elaeophora elaphi TaxID=1147741 RepID=A0A0R3RQ91_9BILA
MSVADFLKDLPSRNKANFSSFLKQSGKPVVSRMSKQSDDEKRIVFDMKPLLLRYLQSNWGNSSTCSTSVKFTSFEFLIFNQKTVKSMIRGFFISVLPAKNSVFQSTRSERKRASDVSNNTTDESESTSGARVKTRRRE